MTEIRQSITFDDSGLLNGLKEISKEADSANKSLTDVSKASDKMAKDFKEDSETSKKYLDKVTDGLDKQAKQTKKSADETSAWRKQVTGAARDVNIFGVNIGQTVDKLQAKRAAMIGATQAIGGGTKALKLFRIALASTGIGLLIVALGSMVTYFTKSQKGLDQLNIAFKAIGSVIDNVIDRVSRVGEGFANIFSGNVRKGLGQIKTSFAGIGDEIRKDVAAATDLEKRHQELIKVQRALTVEEAKRRTEIEKLREESRKQGISEQEAIALLEKAGQLEDSLAAKRTAAAREEYEIIKERNALADSKNADLDAEAEALARLEGIEGQRARKNRQLLSELQSYRNKSAAENAAAAKAREEQVAAEREEVKALKDAYIGLVDTIDEKLASQELDKLSGRERLAAERALALEEINLLEEKAKAAAIAAGEEYNLAEKFLQIRENIIESYKEEARNLNREENAIVVPLKPELPDNAQDAADKAAKALATSLQKGVEKNKDIFEEIKIQMAAWMGLDANEMAIFEDSARALFGSIGELYSDSINDQIDDNQRLIESLQERGNAVENELNRELELQDKGRANNVEGKRAELAAIRKEEERAQKEADKLRKRQQANQLAANLVKQGSNLATAVTEIISANAGIPIIGILNAGIAISAMFAAFKQAKAQARGVVGQRAYKGGVMGDYLDQSRKRRSGFVKRGGMSDIPGRGDGYSVEGTDLVIGANEFMMNEKTSMKQRKAFEMINSGAYDDINLADVLSNMPGSSVNIDDMKSYNRLTSIRQHKIDRHKREHKDRLVVDTLNRNFRELIRAQKDREDLYPLDILDNGYVLKTASGMKIIRK